VSINPFFSICSVDRQFWEGGRGKGEKTDRKWVRKGTTGSNWGRGEEGEEDSKGGRGTGEAFILATRVPLHSLAATDVVFKRSYA